MVMLLLLGRWTTNLVAGFVTCTLFGWIGLAYMYVMYLGFAYTVRMQIELVSVLQHRPPGASMFLLLVRKMVT